ncbi:MAG TPA: MFS transporter [Actinocrinis sp.]|nr:MFS transporter [Actinocrinis sp.]
MKTDSAPSAVDTATAPTASGRLALVVITGALALDVGNLNIINAALPAIGSHFGLAADTLQWVMTSYALTFAGFLLLSGRMADVLGRRKVFMVGVGLFSVAALGAAVAPDAAVLIIARALQGIGAALSGPAALALLSEVFPPGPQRNRAFGIYAAVGSTSASAGLVLGGVLTQLLTWRSVFVVAVLFGVLLLLAAKSALPASVRRPHSLDLPGAGAVTVGLVLVVFGVSRSQQVGWTSPSVVASLAVAVVLLVAFVVWERRVKEPLVLLGIFRAASVRAATLTALLSYTTAIGLLFFAPLYLQNMLGWSPLESALAILPLSCAVFVVSNYFTGGLLSRFGQRPLLIAGLALIALGIGSCVTTSLTGDYWWQMMPGVTAIGLGMGLSFPAMTAAGLAEVPQEQHGVAGAINVVAQQIGASVGLVFLVLVASAASGSADNPGKLNGYHNAYLVAAALCVVGIVIIAFGGKWNSHPEPEQVSARAGA